VLWHPENCTTRPTKIYWDLGTFHFVEKCVLYKTHLLEKFQSGFWQNFAQSKISLNYEKNWFTSFFRNLVAFCNARNFVKSRFEILLTSAFCRAHIFLQNKPFRRSQWILKSSVQYFFQILTSVLNSSVKGQKKSLVYTKPSNNMWYLICFIKCNEY